MTYKQHRKQIYERVLAVDKDNFADLALAIFYFQASYSSVYSQYLKLLNIEFQDITDLSQIPFLPISFFKTHQLKTGDWQEEMVFTSSGTTAKTTSRHFVKQSNFYLSNCKFSWEEFYGKVKDYLIIALLPSYLEREGSSLIYMAEDFIKTSKYEQSGFFLSETEKLLELLIFCQKTNTPTLLLGVSFALLDLAEKHSLDLSNIIVMETGGMKGRRKEMTREELHHIFYQSFNIKAVHSEYGMTELMSQAYSKGKGLFYPAPTMQVRTREITDPFSTQKHGKTGAINIIDLANLDTCSFIATDDLGKVYSDGSFEILGRLDRSDLRGCNLLILEE